MASEAMEAELRDMRRMVEKNRDDLAAERKRREEVEAALAGLASAGEKLHIEAEEEMVRLRAMNITASRKLGEAAEMIQKLVPCSTALTTLHTEVRAVRDEMREHAGQSVGNQLSRWSDRLSRAAGDTDA